MGAATTGSGRYLTGDFIGADVVRNEITAQATAAAAINPQVDTILEIGGQDSKFISLRNGAIVDFMMNKVCAAGTGSYLEEQAEKLGISIREEFGELALASQKPVRLGERCTVFMESDLVHHQQRGAAKEDLVAGLSYSIVQNYLNKVAEDRPIGDTIFYQGATAANRGIVAAFQQVLGKPITVPPHHDVTGAIGAALLAMRERTWETSRFKGFDLAHREYHIKSFECQGCPNTCEIRQVEIAGEKPLFYGGRCEKYEVAREQQAVDLPDLVREREDLLYGPETSAERQARPPGDSPDHVLPGAHALLPDFLRGAGLHRGLLSEDQQAGDSPGCGVPGGGALLPGEGGPRPHPGPPAGRGQAHLPPQHHRSAPSPPRNPAGAGLPHGPVTGLHPAHGHRFCPLRRPASEPGALFRPGLPGPAPGPAGSGERIWGSLSLRWTGPYKRPWPRKRLITGNSRPGAGKSWTACRREARLMILVGRPYNALDPGMNLNLHRKLRQLGVLAMPMDFLPVDEVEDLEEIKPMFWRFGQKILGVAEHIRKDPRLYGVFITNFGCGPDSFIQHFFRDRMRGKPYLEIEIDEHSADVGAITRLEAFLDSLQNVTVQPAPARASRPRVTGSLRRKIYLPYMADHVLALVAAYQACGAEAEALPESDAETLELGRRLTSGKECYPLILTTGDLAKLVQRPDFDPDHSSFFMPNASGPCRFGQYNRYQRLVLDELGYPQVPVYAPDQDVTMYEELDMVGEDFDRIAWNGFVAIDLLEKKLWQTRPYERYAGETDKVYQHFLQKTYEALRDRGDLAGVLRNACRTFNERVLERLPGETRRGGGG